MSSRLTFRDAVAAFLKQHPHEWIPAIRFEQIGGRQAWPPSKGWAKKLVGERITSKQRLGFEQERRDREARLIAEALEMDL